MRQYFDEDESEVDRPRRDTEVTLGAGTVVGACLVLVLVCILCFGWGYAVGHRSPALPPAKAASTTAAPDQEPLQGNDTIPKPSAVETSPAPQTDAASTSTASGAPGTGDGTNASAPGQPASGPNGQTPGAAGGTASPQVQPALPGAASTNQPMQPGATPSIRAAVPNQVQLMVQIAAVAHAEDAQVLEGALRKRGYPVVASRDPSDGLIHVRIGPFSSQDEAIRWRDKLLGDGYNAQVQQ